MKDISSKSNTKTLKPHWAFYFWSYLTGILLTPLLIGILIILYTRRKQLSHHYILADTSITAKDGDYSQKFDLINLRDASVHQTWIQEKFDVGLVKLKKEGAEMALSGIKHPYKMKDIILTVSTNLKQQRDQKPDPPRKPEPKKMSSDRIDYLTGLWQQGLLSDSDYEKERRHFE